jgi:hypothetical protein
MIVVVVRENDGINRRERVKVDARRDTPPRSQGTQW